MSNVLFNVDTKALIQLLVTILVIEEHLSSFSEARDSQQWTSTVLVVLVGVRLWCPHLTHLTNLEYSDRVTWNTCFNVNFIVNEFASILVPSLLLNNIGADIDELLGFTRPSASSIVGSWQKHLDKSVVSVHRRIVDDNEERAGILLLVNWTLHNGLVLGEGVTGS